MHAELGDARQRMYNSYELLLQGLKGVKMAGRQIKGSCNLRDYLLHVCMYADMALSDAQAFFEAEWNGDEAERDMYMSQAHLHVGSAVEHVQFLCDQHEECLRDQRAAAADQRAAAAPPTEGCRAPKRQRPSVEIPSVEIPLEAPLDPLPASEFLQRWV